MEEYSNTIGITQPIVQTLNLDESNSLGSSYYSLIKSEKWNYEFIDKTNPLKNKEIKRVMQMIKRMYQI